jgi:hypothetical protein
LNRFFILLIGVNLLYALILFFHFSHFVFKILKFSEVPDESPPTMRFTALLVLALVVLASAKHISRGDDSDRLSCSVCRSALDKSTIVAANSCQNSAAFDLAALSSCRRATHNALPEQRSLCIDTLMGQCPLVQYDMFSQRSSAYMCAMLGAAGEKCENESATPEFSMELSQRMGARPVKAPTNGVLLDIPVRFMWGWTGNVNGYCGETTIQMAGLYYGNWFSQEQVRYAAGNAEVIIDVNAHTAIGNLFMTFQRWDINKQKQPQGQNFLKWSAAQLDSGSPVMFGGYLKQKGGDADFDHVMPFLGYEADKSGKITAMYYDDLYSTEVRTLDNPSDVTTRKQCSTSSTPKQPFDYCVPSQYDSGVSITGIVDRAEETYRTMLDVGRWDEPDWGAEDKLHQKPVEMYPSAKISGLEAGQAYHLLRFDEAGAVPASNFIAGSWAVKVDFVASGTEHTLTGLDSIMSDGTYFYRTVRSP